MTMALEPAGNSPYAVMRLELDDAVDLVRGAVGSGISTFDFDRVKVPAGGGVTWEVPSLEGPEAEKALVGVIVGLANKKAYWKESMEDSGGGSPPNCRSEDGILGLGDPGGPCKTCAFNQFGSSEKGEGKACKDTTHVLLIREGSVLPILLSVPPTSIRPIRQFLLRATGRGIPFWGMEITFSLEKEKAGGGQTYSRIVPALSRRLSALETDRFRAMKAELAPLLESATSEAEGERAGYE